MNRTLFYILTLIFSIIEVGSLILGFVLLIDRKWILGGFMALAVVLSNRTWSVFYQMLNNEEAERQKKFEEEINNGNE